MLILEGIETLWFLSPYIMLATSLLVISYSLAPSLFLSNNWNMSPKIAGAFPLFISSIIKKYSFPGFKYAFFRRFVNGPGVNS